MSNNWGYQNCIPIGNNRVIGYPTYPMAVQLVPPYHSTYVVRQNDFQVYAPYSEQLHGQLSVYPGPLLRQSEPLPYGLGQYEPHLHNMEVFGDEAPGCLIEGYDDTSSNFGVPGAEISREEPGSASQVNVHTCPPLGTDNLETPAVPLPDIDEDEAFRHLLEGLQAGLSGGRYPETPEIPTEQTEPIVPLHLQTSPGVDIFSSIWSETTVNVW